MNEMIMPGSTAGQMPVSRYVMPQFEERTPYGFKRQDPYTKLFEDRVIFLGVQVDDTSADDIMAQLLVLESQDPDRDITLYINSPGGSFTALTAIYDTMQYIKPEIQTVCLGQAASAAAVLLAAGTPASASRCPTPASSSTSLDAGSGTGTGLGHRDPGRRGAADAPVARADPGRPLEQDRRAGLERHRARPLPHRRTGEGLRSRRPGAHLPQGV